MLVLFATNSYLLFWKVFMRILVIGAGMMGWAAAFDMARSDQVQAVTLADHNEQRLE